MKEETEQIDMEVVNGLTEFFDLLARYDFEDHKSEILLQNKNDALESTL